jgi:hypothetical protein
MASTEGDPDTPVHWELIHLPNGSDTWAWQRLKIDGSIELTSSPLSDFGTAVADALKHGFRPKEHHWIVKSKSSVTHFHPGQTPVSVRPGHQVAQHFLERAPASKTPPE